MCNPLNDTNPLHYFLAMTENPELPTCHDSNERWAWFDLDNTLWNFSANSLTALDATYDVMHLERWWPDRQQWFDDYHEANNEMWRLYERAEIDQDTLRVDRFRIPLAKSLFDGGQDEAVRLAWELDRVYLEILGRQKVLMDGAMDAVSRARAEGYRIGVLTNGFNNVQHNKLRSSGLEPLVDLMVLSDEIGINKPDTRLFRYAEQRARTSADHCVMIGDNRTTDIDGALAAGWRAIWYDAKGMSLEQPETAIADNMTVCRNLHELQL